MEKIKCWVSHICLKHGDFGGNVFHEAPKNETSFQSLLNTSVHHILEAKQDL